ncbi:MAG: hypothetical protein H0X39_08890 [Actinobacteria bacterium]|nr:hypothetical protein [Actinomycetota bacterium]
MRVAAVRPAGPAARALAACALLVTAGGAASNGQTTALAGPSAAARPAIAGSLQQGKKLTATPGTWTGSGTIAYAYQWYRCDRDGAHCGSVHGATKATYTEVVGDVAHTLAVTVHATDSTGTTASYSTLAGVIAPAAARLAASAQPPLTGDPIVGQPLKVEAVGWTPAPATTGFVWLRCNANARLCAPVAGATTDTYTLVAADAGHTLIAAVTGTAAPARRTVLSTSSGLARTAPGPVASDRPSITGTLQRGKKLTGSAGAWSGSGTITYAYQWYRCDGNGAHCASIHGATRSTYTEVAADVGKTIALTVRATDATGTTPGYSWFAGVVAAATATFAVTTQPSLSGTPAVGQALKVSGGTFTTTPTSATYAWVRCNSNGRVCSLIAGATTDTYTVTSADAGHALLALVTANGGTAKQTASTTAVAVPG